jgi:hypothetical protein
VCRDVIMKPDYTIARERRTDANGWQYVVSWRGVLVGHAYSKRMAELIVRMHAELLCEDVEHTNKNKLK